jgi:hypothetical protein
VNKKFYFLAGYSRSGNTLLSSILNQNKNIVATANSPLVQIAYSINEMYNSIWIKNFPEKKGVDNLLKKLFTNYYEHLNAEVIFDRAGWGTPLNLTLLTNKIIEKPKFLLLVRPLIEVLASLVKIHRPKNVYDFVYLEAMHPEKGKVYWDWLSTKTIITQYKKDYLLIKYDDLIKEPKNKIKEIYDFFELKPFKHSFSNLKQLSINNVIYDDSVFNSNSLHLVKKNINKQEYAVEDYLPESIIKEYKEWDYF